MALENLRLIPFSHLDDVNLTVTSAEADYPKTYLQNSQPSWKWRSTSAADQDIEWDAGELVSADAFAAVEANLSGSSTIQITLSEDAGYASPSLDETIDGVLPFYGLGEGPLGLDGLGGFAGAAELQSLRAHFFAPVTYRYGRIRLSDAGNPDGYIEAGKIMLGRSWQPTTNHDWGAEHGREKDARITRTRGGGARSSPATSYRVVTVSFSWLSESDDAELDEIIARYGRKSGVLLSCYPGDGGSLERKFAIYGLLSGWTRSRRNRTQYYSAGLQVEELK